MESPEDQTKNNKELPAATKNVSMTPSITSFLKPTADYLGLALKDYVKDKVESLKAKKRKENVQAHMQSVGVIIGEPLNYDEETIDNIKQLNLFDDWLDGAQDVNPNDEILAKLWQGLLKEIVEGKSRNKVLISTLKSLESHEAELLLKFKNRRLFHPKDSESRYILKKLRRLELIDFDWSFITIIGISYLMAIAMFITIPTFNNIFGETFGVLQLGLMSIIPVAMSISIIPKYRASWLGRRLLDIAPELPSKKPRAL